MAEDSASKTVPTNKSAPGGSASAPALTLPKGGGALRGIGEKFAANPVTGTATFSIPIPTSSGRAGFGPQLMLAYDSGSGNGPFGYGWSLSIPNVTRKTEKGLPHYQDGVESDVFILSGAEDLVPVLENQGGVWAHHSQLRNLPDSSIWTVERYRPRVESAFARIERWTEQTSGEVFWRSISRDNLVNLYGKTANSRIFDPADPHRIFTWLLCESRDPFGNAIYYEYKAEDSAGVPVNAIEELQRTQLGRSAQRYLKRIRYGNRSPYQEGENLALRSDWMFEVVCDYGEHDLNTPTPLEIAAWNLRQDAFSTYKPGYEVRTYRLCQRVLMFHHFPAEHQGANCLVRSTDFTYHASPVASTLTSVSQTGYLPGQGGYTAQRMPPLEFTYTQAIIDPTVHTLNPPDVENLPEGLLSARTQFVDLDGEGLPGVLSEQAGAWFYKPNLGGGSFGALQTVGSPAGVDLQGGRQQLLDLAGDGQLDLVAFQEPLPGFYERHWQAGESAAGWGQFTPFASLPGLDWQDPNLRFVDLDGDGRTDLLVTEQQVFTWYPSQGEAGFGPAQRVYQGLNEDKAPALVFADGQQSHYLADMSGDGLLDVVRIRPGEVSYWPNLGYGCFGQVVHMGSAPRLDTTEAFDPARVHLADIDGSGTTDLVYLSRQGATIYFNQCGNRWSDGVPLETFPAVDTLGEAATLDLLGSGTACLVWSSALPGDARQPLKYIDLMGGNKPHLLSSIKNNLGAETRLEYAPSTRFYIEDRQAGRPWLTRLPFPVHTLARAELFERVSGTRLVTTYKYHHGFFDGIEREFRGFGKVEQWDSESFAKYAGAGLFSETPIVAGEEFHLPPVRTVSWYHTGANLATTSAPSYATGLATEYYAGDPAAVHLPDTQLPPGLTDEERGEACRALKGRLLRQEVYAEDASPQASNPFTATEYAYRLRLLQPQSGNRHAVFFAYESEALIYQYERRPDDPRTNHRLTLAVDEVGNPLQTATVGFARRPVLGRQPEQAHPYLTCTLNQFANRLDAPDWQRAGAPVETAVYELTGIVPAGAVFSIEELAAAFAGVAEIPYETAPAGNLPQKRLVSHNRTLYRRDDLNGALPPGQIEALGLVYEAYRLGLTAGLVTQAYAGRVTNAMLQGEGGYMHSQGDLDWWSPGGQTFYSPNPAHTPAQELAHARQHFFRPRRYLDAFGNATTVDYDPYDLLVSATRDPLGNCIAAVNHYRILAPQRLTDANDNQAAVRFDGLGMVIATFMLGKAGEGSHFDANTDETSLLDDPAARLEIDLWVNFNDPQHRAPVFIHTFAREQHGPANPRWQESYTYSDGLGRVIEKKVQAEAGLAPGRNPDGSLKSDIMGNLIWEPCSDRWIGSGRTAFDNKGNPVKQYEPFFDSRPTFTAEIELTEWGVTPLLRYDALSRRVRTDLPNGSYSKLVFDAWLQVTWDENDTLLDSTWYAERGAPPPNGPQPATPQGRAAWLAARHSGTPLSAHLDPLGRTFLTVADNGLDAGNNPLRFETRLVLDIQGNQLAVIDPLNRRAQEAIYDLMGRCITQRSMEAGARWAFFHALNGLVRRWDSRGFARHTQFDALQRPSHVYVQPPGGVEALVERLVYGEAHPDATRNLRTRLFLHYDQGGVAAQERFDFQGNPVEASRQFAKEYRSVVNWSALAGLADPAAVQAAAVPMLDVDERYTNLAQYDALNRLVLQATPHNASVSTNVVQPQYNPANMLEKVHVWLRRSSPPSGPLDPTSADLHLVTNIDYNARRQRVLVDFGSGVQTTYEYDPQTFRMSRLVTQRPVAFPPTARTVQDLVYTYDAVGNPVQMQDDSDLSNVVFFNNIRVDPSITCEYDPLYRLVKASGREHLGRTGGVLNPPQQIGDDDSFQTGLAHPFDGQAMGRYTEQYEYDPVGNLLKVTHQAGGSWTRRYAYNEPSLLEPARMSNRLSRSSLPGDNPNGPFSAAYIHDEHGNLTRLPHLPVMVWDYADQLQATARQVVINGVPETTYYVYDAHGQRLRKVTERAAPLGVTPTRKHERIYLDGIEIYREYGPTDSPARLQRESLPVMDGGQRLALVETKTLDTLDPTDLNIPLVRYQHTDPLGSVALELDQSAVVITHEEYFPFGSTAYQALNKSLRAAAKRYRFSGKERDEESGLLACGQRYYAAWLGRWTSCDPAGLVDGTTNLYPYARNSPLRLADPTGLDPEDFQYHLTPPSMLTIRSSEDIWAERLRGTLAPPQRLQLNLSSELDPAAPDLSLTPTSGQVSPTPGASTSMSGGGAAPAGGTTPAAGTGEAKPPGASDSPGVDVSGGILPPSLQIDYRSLRFSADTSSVSLRLSLPQGSQLTAGYAYGGNISFTSSGPGGTGSIAVDPSSGVTTFSARGDLPGGLRVSTGLSTEGTGTYGMSGPGWNYSIGYNPTQTRFSLSAGYGPELPPTYNDLSLSVMGGYYGLTSALSGVPGVLHDPLSAVDYYHAHEQDFSNMRSAYTNLHSVADTPTGGNSGPQFSARLNLGVAPLTIQNSRPTGGFTLTAQAGILF